MASFECPYCIGLKEEPGRYELFERWWNNGEWGIPDGISLKEAKVMLEI